MIKKIQSYICIVYKRVEFLFFWVGENWDVGVIDQRGEGEKTS